MNRDYARPHSTQDRLAVVDRSGGGLPMEGRRRSEKNSTCGRRNFGHRLVSGNCLFSLTGIHAN
jgi:hypothetical protein